jgi:prepilin-type N-terminal cleavage/methylation domain-containing protein
MRRKGFTLVELLVVIAIIALLMSILMPALAQVRRIAVRIICGTHLHAIGKAMLVYAQDNGDDFPRSGGRLSVWSDLNKIKQWDGVATGALTAEEVAFGTSPRAKATITSCFYLLVKYSDGVPKIFNCGGDLDAYVFKLSDSTSTTLTDLKDAWDYGDGTNGTYWPGQYCSYSYHMPFSYIVNQVYYCYALQASDSSACPLCADRNPYLDKNAIEIYTDRLNTDDEWAIFTSSTGFYDGDGVRNSAAHQREGQNVLYVDNHVEFEKSPNCGVQNDFIWINWQLPYAQMKVKDREWTQQDCTGILNPSKLGKVFPQHIEDAFLVNEYNEAKTEYHRK